MNPLNSLLASLTTFEEYTAAAAVMLRGRLGDPEIEIVLPPEHLLASPIALLVLPIGILLLSAVILLGLELRKEARPA